MISESDSEDEIPLVCGFNIYCAVWELVALGTVLYNVGSSEEYGKGGATPYQLCTYC